MAIWMFGCTMCAFIAGGGLLAIACTKLVELMCEHKGISLMDEDGVEYETE